MSMGTLAFNKNIYIERERILHGGAKIWILFSSGKTILYERAQRVSKILFYCLEGNYQNYVIDKLTCEIMENEPLRSRM